jgi:hypothetical protein
MIGRIVRTLILNRICTHNEYSLGSSVGDNMGSSVGVFALDETRSSSSGENLVHYNAQSSRGVWSQNILGTAVGTKVVDVGNVALWQNR